MVKRTNSADFKINKLDLLWTTENYANFVIVISDQIDIIVPDFSIMEPKQLDLTDIKNWNDGIKYRAVYSLTHNKIEFFPEYKLEKVAPNEGWRMWDQMISQENNVNAIKKLLENWEKNTGTPDD